MAIFLWVSGLAILYFLLLFFVPKGNLLNELLALSQYWIKIFTLPKRTLKISRFSYGPHRRQYFLLYQDNQEKSTQKHIIVYFHGGAWGFGSPESFQSNAQVLVNQGYDVFMPSYRRVPFYNYQHIRADITMAMERIREVQSELGYGNKKLILGGMSAGGHLAALILYDRKQLALSGFAPHNFSGLFLLAAPLELMSMRRTPILWFLAGSRKGKMFARANPVNYVNSNEKTPVLIIHGDKDGIVAYSAAADFYTEIEKLNPGITQFRRLENGGHLDVAKWVYQDFGPQEWLFEWLKGLN